MSYPGFFIKTGTKNIRLIKSIQLRLNTLGCGPLSISGKFGKSTREAVELFQARATDFDGSPLKVDGIVGPLTWGALFGEDIQITEDTSLLLATVLEVAEQEVGVLEEPPGSNRGPRVDQYIQSVGLDPAEGPPGGYAWCVAFLYWCFQQAAENIGTENPAIKTAGVLDHWAKAGKQGIHRILPAEVEKNIALLRPGLIFVMKTGEWQGHMGIITGYRGGKLLTIEGNTSVDGNPEGIGVFRRHGRVLADINKGYIDYSCYD